MEIIETQPIKIKVIRSKASKYIKERLTIAKKILNILGITKENKTIIINDIEIELQQKILNMETEIKMFFNAGKWNVFKKGKNSEKAYIYITKNIMKEIGIIMINSTKYLNGKNIACYEFKVNDDLLCDTI